MSLSFSLHFLFLKSQTNLEFLLCINCLVIIKHSLSLLLVVTSFVLLFIMMFFFRSTKKKEKTNKHKKLSLSFSLFSLHLSLNSLVYFLTYILYVSICFLLFILVSIIFVQECICVCVCVCTALLCTKEKHCMKKHFCLYKTTKIYSVFTCLFLLLTSIDFH